MEMTWDPCGGWEDPAKLTEQKAQEKPSVSVHWPRRQFPVVYHKALLPARGRQPPWKNYKSNQTHRRQSTGTTEGTPDSTGLRLISA